MSTDVNKAFSPTSVFFDDGRAPSSVCQSWILDLAGFGRGFCGVVKVVAKMGGFHRFGTDV
jgi:hypothetical protein